MLDNKGRLFGRLSLIDLFIVLVIIAAAVWFFGFRNSGEVQAETTAAETYIVKYKIIDASEFTSDYFKVGDTLEDFQKSHGMGVITDIKIGEGYAHWADEQGVFKKSVLEDTLSIEITSEVTAYPSENGIIINGANYLVAQDVTLRVGTGKLFIKIVGIDAKGGQ